MQYKNPKITTDIIIRYKGGIIIIERKNNPHGFALPGGFVDYGETLEKAAIREAKEETNLSVKLITQLKTYSDPKRDPRYHTISTVFIADGKGILKAGDDAKAAKVYKLDEIPKLCFDHGKIIKDYKKWLKSN